MRNVDEKDQRMMRLDLTEKGQACIEHVKAIAEKMDEIAFYRDQSRGKNASEKNFISDL